MNKPIIIFGSSRSKGHTFRAVEMISKKLDSVFIDLAHYKINDFNYLDKNVHDDFLIIIEAMLQHKTIILATPIYWYTMSTIMKKFVDRWSDLLTKNNSRGI